ncbi:MAG: phosphatidylglycerophosphatase A, partial [Elusimicrobia bacterium]|nr:phosphatidylglycerophosphatase A [Elusimicrobiota bacterium]
HDDPRIVIDEITGYWVAVAFLPKTLSAMVSAFILFRIFDTVKPGFIKKIDGWSHGMGIVLDDVLAGILANIFVRAAFALKIL